MLDCIEYACYVTKYNTFFKQKKKLNFHLNKEHNNC